MKDAGRVLTAFVKWPVIAISFVMLPLAVMVNSTSKTVVGWAMPDLGTSRIHYQLGPMDPQMYEVVVVGDDVHVFEQRVRGRERPQLDIWNEGAELWLAAGQPRQLEQWSARVSRYWDSHVGLIFPCVRRATWQIRGFRFMPSQSMKLTPEVRGRVLEAFARDWPEYGAQATAMRTTGMHVEERVMPGVVAIELIHLGMLGVVLACAWRVVR